MTKMVCDRPIFAAVRCHRSSSGRRAFTLTEVMFAVIILGIGFILIAGMFPVMISQSKLTVDETTAAAVSRGAFAIGSRVADGGDYANIVGPASYPLMPETNFLFTPPAIAEAQADAATAYSIVVNPDSIVQPYSQEFVPGKVLSFNDDRLTVGNATTPDYRDNLFNAIRGNIQLPSDPRFAWVPLYSRDCTYFNKSATAQNFSSAPADLANFTKIQSPFVTIYFVPVSVRNRSIYDSGTLTTNTDVNRQGAALNPAVFANLEPRPVGVQIYADDPAQPPSAAGFLMEFTPLPPVTPNGPYAAVGPYAPGNGTFNAVAEGSFMVLSDDRIALPVNDRGRMNGKIFRVGIRRLDLETGIDQIWEVAPGSGTPLDPGADGITGGTSTDDIIAIGSTTNTTNSKVTVLGPAVGLIIGRNTNGAVGGFEGVPQDVGVFVSFLKVN